MLQNLDAILVGADHNSLVCARFFTRSFAPDIAGGAIFPYLESMTNPRRSMNQTEKAVLEMLGAELDSVPLADRTYSDRLH